MRTKKFFDKKISFETDIFITIFQFVITAISILYFKVNIKIWTVLLYFLTLALFKYRFFCKQKDKRLKTYDYLNYSFFAIGINTLLFGTILFVIILATH